MRNSKCSGCNEPLWVDISDTSYNGSMRRLSTSWKAQREGVWLVDEGHYQGVLAFASPTDSSDVQGSHSPHQRDQPTPRRLPGHHLMDQLPILIELNQTNLNELETILTDEPSYEPNKPGRKIRDATDYAFNLMPVSFADVAKRLDLSRILNLPDDHVESAHWLVHTLKTHAWLFEAVAEGRPSTTMPMNDPKWLATCSTVSEQASLRGSSTGLKPYCNRTEFRTRTARAVCGNCWRRVIESGSHFYSGGYL